MFIGFLQLARETEPPFGRELRLAEIALPFEAQPAPTANFSTKFLSMLP